MLTDYTRALTQHRLAQRVKNSLIRFKEPKWRRLASGYIATRLTWRARDLARNRDTLKARETSLANDGWFYNTTKRVTYTLIKKILHACQLRPKEGEAWPARAKRITHTNGY